MRTEQEIILAFQSLECVAESAQKRGEGRVAEQARREMGALAWALGEKHNALDAIVAAAAVMLLAKRAERPSEGSC